jgi:hypothetical protein
MNRRRSERGSASIFVIGMSIVLLVCAGLVVDGGLAINARMRVADDAEQAARVAADSIDVELLRSGGALVIDAGLARQRASAYLARRGYSAGQYQIDVDDAEVEVDVEDTTETSLLKLINIDSYDVRASARSVPETEAD